VEKNKKQGQPGQKVDPELIKKRTSKKAPDLDYILRNRQEIENNPYLLAIAQQIQDIVRMDEGFQRFLDELEEEAKEKEANEKEAKEKEAKEKEANEKEAKSL